MENNMAAEDVLMTPEDVTAWTGLSTGALAQLRYKGTGPKFVKPTPRTVLYFRSHVLMWLEQSVCTQTGERV